MDDLINISIFCKNPKGYKTIIGIVREIMIDYVTSFVIVDEVDAS
jgi:hypothetical protein